MQIEQLFETWRAFSKGGWGLAWFLANEFCRRFYSSHGIVPHVIEYEGLGYYGIELDYLPCKVNGRDRETLGRLTANGDVENWRTGTPGDHGLDTSSMCKEGFATESILKQAFLYMDLLPVPAESHLGCRHKRRGASYELIYEIATSIALRNDQQRIEIWNAPEHTKGFKKEVKEPIGGFLFIGPNDNKVFITGDGRFLRQKPEDLWRRYMLGESAFTLSKEIEQYLLNIS